jgi:hypothetical protein
MYNVINKYVDPYNNNNNNNNYFFFFLKKIKNKNKNKNKKIYLFFFRCKVNQLHEKKKPNLLVYLSSQIYKQSISSENIMNLSLLVII